MDNEAAERLRNAARVWVRSDARIAQMGEILEEALAAERRATCRRILERLEGQLSLVEKRKLLNRIRKIIQEEATR